MSFEKFLNDYEGRGLLRRQAADMKAVKDLIKRSLKDLKAAQANLKIDEGIAYTVAYLAMLHAARGFMLMKGHRPAGNFQHKTCVEFMMHYLGNESKALIENFDRMRRKRNIFTYESDILISVSDAEKAINRAVEFVELIKRLIHQDNPQMKLDFNLDKH